MSPAKSRWERLRAEIEDGRQVGVAELTNGILRRLKDLGAKDHCSRNAIGWLQTRKTEGKRAGTTKIDFKRNADAQDAWGHPAVRLRGLEHLEDGALLTISIEIDGRRSSILGYSVSIAGTQRAHSEPSAPASAAQCWYARVDLTEAPAGQGLCGHALLHCHVGVDPEPNEKFSARVPLPWLDPADALDWLLASVDPRLEPTPEQ